MTSINLQILSDWKQTLTVAFQKLRRIPFLIEDIFSFGDFDPQINFSGMTVTNFILYRARYLKIFNMMWVSFSATMTLAAPLTSFITIVVPGTGPGTSNLFQQSTGIRVVNNGAIEVGISIFQGTNNQLFLFRVPTTAFTAGNAAFYVNTFLEVA